MAGTHPQIQSTFYEFITLVIGSVAAESLPTLNKLNVPTEKFGDSTGSVDI
jgi:hypothetical protein